MLIPEEESTFTFFEYEMFTKNKNKNKNKTLLGKVYPEITQSFRQELLTGFAINIIV